MSTILTGLTVITLGVVAHASHNGTEPPLWLAIVVLIAALITVAIDWTPKPATQQRHC